MDYKNFVAKTVSIILILSTVYQILLSINAIFFLYPELISGNHQVSLRLEMGLADKALLLYATMIVDGAYGLGLLLKPSREVEIFHIVLGAILAILSIFFITKTPFTTDPIFNFLINLFKV
jgi:hypothetical protein